MCGEPLGNPVEGATTPSVPARLISAFCAEHVALVTLVTGAHAAICENVTTRIEERTMQQIRIERKAPTREDRDRYAVLPLDPRDQDILRAKLLLRRRTVRAAPTGSGAPRPQ